MWLSLLDVFFGDAELMSIKTCKICIQGIDAESEVFVIQSQTDSWYTVHYSGIMCWIWGFLAVGRHAHLEATTATLPRDVSSLPAAFFQDVSHDLVRVPTSSTSQNMRRGRCKRVVSRCENSVDWVPPNKGIP